MTAPSLWRSTERWKKKSLVQFRKLQLNNNFKLNWVQYTCHQIRLNYKVILMITWWLKADCWNPTEAFKTDTVVFVQGCRGTPVKKRSHRTRSCQGDCRCCHVGSGKHKCAPHGDKTFQIKDFKANSQSNRLSLFFHLRALMNSMKELLLSILNRLACFLLGDQIATHFLTLEYNIFFVICPQILKGLEMESRMHIRFLDVDTSTIRCGKSTSWRSCSCTEMFMLLLILVEPLESLNGQKSLDMH